MFVVIGATQAPTDEVIEWDQLAGAYVIPAPSYRAEWDIVISWIAHPESSNSQGMYDPWKVERYSLDLLASIKLLVGAHLMLKKQCMHIVHQQFFVVSIFCQQCNSSAICKQFFAVVC